MFNNRLIIFVIYNRHNSLEEYVEFIAKENCEVCKHQIIIVNGYICDCDVSKLKKYSTNVLLRNNLGFDAGAYKDILHELYFNGTIKEYEEIVLMNDSFYGPIHTWKEVFNEMNKLEVDYWGLIKNGEVNMGDYWTKPHIQGFFLAIRKPILDNEDFKSFWSEMEYPESYNKAVEDFELAINDFFEEHHYKGCSYIELHDGETYIQNGVMSFTKYSYELIKQCKCPIVKRKALLSSYYTECIPKVFNYIKNETTYDLNYIIMDWKQEELRIEDKKYCISKLIDFCGKYLHIYIYGHGKYGQIIERVIQAIGIKNYDFVVSKKSPGENAIEFDKCNINNNIGFIISVGAKYYDEIYKTLLSKVDASQIFKYESNEI